MSFSSIGNLIGIIMSAFFGLALIAAAIAMYLSRHWMAKRYVDYPSLNIFKFSQKTLERISIGWAIFLLFMGLQSLIPIILFF